MNSKQFHLAVKTYIELAQKDFNFLQKGNQLKFKQSLFKCFRQFQENYDSIAFFISKKKFEQEQVDQKEEEEEQKNSSHTKKLTSQTILFLPTKREIFFLSNQNFIWAESDLRCGSFLLKNMGNNNKQDFAMQILFCFQQAAEKSIKALWLLNTQNVTNLLNSANSRRENPYYHSHNLIHLAEGLERGN